MTQLYLDINSAEHPRKWHYWIYYLNCKKCFLYGFIAQSHADITTKTLLIHLDHEISYIHGQISEDKFDVFKKGLAEMTLDLSFFKNEYIKFEYCLKVKASFTEVRRCFKRITGKVYSNLTCLSIGSLCTGSIKQLSLLQTLEDDTSLEFTSNYAGLLGAFEIFVLPEWSEDKEKPFSISFLKDYEKDVTPQKRDTFIFRRRPDFSQHRHFIFINIYQSKYLLYSHLHKIEPNQLELPPIILEDHFNEIRYAIFEETGDIIHFENLILCDGIDTSLVLTGPTLILEGDRVSKQAQGIKDIAITAKTVPLHSLGDHVSVSFKKRPPCVPYLRETHLYAASLKSQNSNDAWFDKGIEGSLKSLLHITNLLNEPLVKKIIISDPYFDQSAFGDLIPRIGTRGLSVYILTNLRPPNKDATVNHEWEKLIEYAKNYERVLQCKVNIFNLLDKRNPTDQVFHDRYIALYHGSQKPIIYMLSNSLNSRSKNFPLCITRLNSNISSNIDNYLGDMLDQTNVVDTKSYSIKQMWKNYDK